jgi:hypothetical protein
MLYFARVSGDHERVVSHYLAAGQATEALAALRAQARPEPYYRFSPALMERIPYETVTAWIGEARALDPKRLIPALMRYDGSRVTRVQDVRTGAPTHSDARTEREREKQWGLASKWLGECVVRG